MFEGYTQVTSRCSFQRPASWGDLGIYYC